MTKSHDLVFYMVEQFPQNVYQHIQDISGWFVPTSLCSFNSRPELISDANIAITMIQRLRILAETLCGCLSPKIVQFAYNYHIPSIY